MKKQFEYKGFQFEVEVKLNEAATERQPNGKTIYPVTAMDITGEYNVETEITTGGGLFGPADKKKELEKGIEEVITACKEWADQPTKTDWDKNVLSQQGFKENPDNNKSVSTLKNALQSVSESDALFIGKSILKWSISDEGIIHQVKNELLSSPNFWNAQTNLSGSDWLKIFQYLQMNGYEINALY